MHSWLMLLISAFSRIATINKTKSQTKDSDNLKIISLIFIFPKQLQ